MRLELGPELRASRVYTHSQGDARHARLQDALVKLEDVLCAVSLCQVQRTKHSTSCKRVPPTHSYILMLPRYRDLLLLELLVQPNLINLVQLLQLAVLFVASSTNWEVLDQQNNLIRVVLLGAQLRNEH